MAESSVPSPPRFNPGPAAEAAAGASSMGQSVAELAASVKSGARTAADAAAAGEELLRSSYEAAYRKGLASLGVRRFGDFDAASIAAAARNEARFLGKFMDDVAAGVGTVPWASRAASYARGYDSMYVMGQVQALPWETDIRWVMGTRDHCSDCIALAEASPFSKATLPVVPGGGGTKCLFRCGCRLEYALRRPRTADLSARPGRISRLSASAGEVPEGLRLPDADELEVIRGLWGDVQYHRTAIRYSEPGLRAAHVAARRDSNAALIRYLDDRKLHWTRGQEDALFNPPPGGGAGPAPASGPLAADSKGPVIAGAGEGAAPPSSYLTPAAGLPGPEEPT